MPGTILGLLVIGLVVGVMARAIVPGRHSLSTREDILLGTTGSSLGGLFGHLLFGGGDAVPQLPSFVGSVMGADIAVMGYLLAERPHRTDHAPS